MGPWAPGTKGPTQGSWGVWGWGVHYSQWHLDLNTLWTSNLCYCQYVENSGSVKAPRLERWYQGTCCSAR